MFSKFALTIVSLLIISQNAFAGDQACQKAYSDTVSQCAQDLNFLSPKLRPGAQKACVVDAKITKDACVSGPNVCVTTCQSNYDANVISCQNTYNPVVCSGNLACEAYYQQQRADCISQSVSILNACTLACPL